jgi:hypothetical protein
MTMMQYDLKCRGYMRKLERDWEHTRYIATTIINVNRSRKKPYSPQEIMPLPGDKHNRAKALLPKDPKAYKEELRKLYKLR